MKQILQNMKTGQLSVADVPPPTVQRGRVLVRTAASLISAGTEKMAVDLGKQSLLGKARARPDLVKQVVQKAKNEGLMNTFNAVRSKLGSSTALGYSASGIVIGVGDDVTEFTVGDRVACCGAGFASHAEVLTVPKNMCVRLPEGASFETGAYGTLGAIALQGVRLAEPTLGEAMVVIGLGLLGQLTVQLLKANGCRVFGVDLDPGKVELAKKLGADDAMVTGDAVKPAIRDWTRGRGADAVLITAATMSNEPVQLAGEISRMKGRVVAVGLIGMDVPRNVYYLKELPLKISMSYGPGRYDPEYEERGHDYPFAYVRWTEGRNLEAFLDLAAEGRIDIGALTTHRFSIDDGEQAYQLISGESQEPYLGIVLNYDTEREVTTTVALPAAKAKGPGAAAIRLGLIGAGGYAKSMLLPNFKANGVEFGSIATSSGVSARDTGERFGFQTCAAGAVDVIADPGTNLIVIATRHDSHADYARRALAAGKHVFVEKPLAMNDEELDSLLAVATNSPGRLMCGFNRRFSPMAKAAAEFFAGRQHPLSIQYRINCGRIPRESWIQDPIQGGGRIIGEVCHFIDLMHYLTGSVTTRVFAEGVVSRNHEVLGEDSVFVTLKFADGSNGSIAYIAEGDKAMPKERVEIFGGGRNFIIDDFRQSIAYAGGRETVTKLRNQDKGQPNEVAAVCEMVKTGGAAPIALADLAATTRATFRIRESLRTGEPANVG